jgi:uncharacterized protein (TIRG00374 family)
VGTALGASLGAALLAAIFADARGEVLLSTLAAADPRWLVLVALASFSAYGARAWRIGALLAPLSHIPYSRLLSATYVGYMAGLFVPRSGELLRPWLISRGRSLPAGAAFAAIVIERVLDAATVLALFGTSMLTGGGGQALDPTWRHRLQFGSGLVAALAIATLLALIVLQARPKWVLGTAARALAPLPHGLAEATMHGLRSFSSGLKVLRASPRHLALVACQSLLVWFCIASGAYASSRAFGIDISFQGAFVVLGFIMVGVSLPTPGAIGGFHAAFVLSLTLIHGVGREPAALAAVVCHGINQLCVLLVGLSLLTRAGLSLRGLSRAGPLGD